MAFISIAEVDEEASLEECWGALPEWKVNQYKKASSARFRSASSTGYLLALVLAERASSRKLDIVRGPQGKPAFASEPNIQFSIAHSGDYAVCALGEGPVGIDIENASRDFSGIASHVLSAGERAVRGRLAPAHRNRFACAIWTLKEALGKYQGCGLGYDLKTVSFDLEGRVPVLSDGCKGPSFRTFAVGRDYLLSVCTAEDESISWEFTSSKELLETGRRRSLW